MGKPKILMALYAGGKHAKEEARLLGTVENELGIRKLVEEHGYELVTTDDKDPEPNSAFDENLEDAEIIITTPFYPAYVTRSRIAKAPKLKLCITAGVGSDHYDLEACNERGIAVIEVTGSNVVS
ncbi:Formate dehydrogenase, partial [Candida maltosa Xu316]